MAKPIETLFVWTLPEQVDVQAIAPALEQNSRQVPLYGTVQAIMLLQNYVEVLAENSTDETIIIPRFPIPEALGPRPLKLEVSPENVLIINLIDGESVSHSGYVFHVQVEGVSNNYEEVEGYFQWSLNPEIQQYFYIDFESPDYVPLHGKGQLVREFIEVITYYIDASTKLGIIVPLLPDFNTPGASGSIVGPFGKVLWIETIVDPRDKKGEYFYHISDEA